MRKTYIKTTVDLDSEYREKFQAIYPMKGAFKWFINRCLEEFVDLHTLERKPEDLVRFVVGDVLQTSSPEDEEEEE